MKIEIEGIEITYKSVLDLNEKVRTSLLETKKERTAIETKFRLLRKREKFLEKFLGTNKEPDPVDSK